MDKVYKLADDILVRIINDWAAKLFLVVYIAMLAFAAHIGAVSRPPETTTVVDCTTLLHEDTQPVESSPVPTELSVFDQVLYHNALARSMPIDQSCYDPKTRLWFVHSIRDENDENWGKGWYYSSHDDLNVLTIGNGTLSLTNSDDVFNVKITPDVTGLNCQQHIPSV